LRGGSASAKPVEPGFSERVSQLPQAAASSTPMGLGGGAGSTLCALRAAAGHVSIRYSCISWRQLLTISCTKKQKKPQKILLHSFLCSLFEFLTKKKTNIYSQNDPSKIIKLYSGHRKIRCLLSRGKPLAFCYRPPANQNLQQWHKARPLLLLSMARNPRNRSLKYKSVKFKLLAILYDMF
jgi:hypothetical protein